MLDLRLPMGLMFSLVGAMLAIYGAFTRSYAMYNEHSLGINVNLWWGLGLLGFGLLTLGLARWAAAAEKAAQDQRK
jgi:hypothetical protein